MEVHAALGQGFTLSCELYGLFWLSQSGQNAGLSGLLRIRAGRCARGLGLWRIKTFVSAL